MLAVGEARAQGGERLRRLIGEGPLRHVSVALEGSDTPPGPPQPSGLARWIARWLPLDRAGANGERRIAFGDDTLLIRPDPASEVGEILREAQRLLGILVLFSLGTLAAAWFATHRALRPVRALEERLEQLSRDEQRAPLPPFELKEFRRIAGAIDRLADSLARSRETERRLGRCLMELQEAERRDLARELHDEFGQSLAAIGVAAAFVERHAGTAPPAQLAECARDVRAESAKMSAHVRGLLSQLRPHGLERLGMAAALHELLDGWRQRHPAIALQASLPAAFPPLATAARLALYRSVQEALTNVLRHSGARRVEVALSVAADTVRLSIADDGAGRAAQVERDARGGLLGMRERAEMAGGRLAFRDAPGRGLEIELTLPSRGQEDTEDDPDIATR
jgi:two-component system sensor histidine kinase UhpB